MEKLRPIVYKINNKQTIPLAIFTIVLGGLSTWLVFFLKPHNHVAHYCFIGLGIFLYLLTLFCIRGFIERVTGPKEGLIISDEGIQDNTTYNGVGVIKWEDIKGIREEFVAMNKFVRIDVYNPQDYVAKAKNAMKRRMLKNNTRHYGAPFIVTARALEGIKHAELFEIMRTEFAPVKEKRDAMKKAGEAPIDSSTDILSENL
jgi:hypothetical protein